MSANSLRSGLSRLTLSALLFLVLFPLLIGQCPAQARFLGLKLAPAEQLQGIPLASLPFSGSELPKAVDLSHHFPPPGQQGNQNSCVGWSLAYALKSYQEKLEEKWPITSNAGRLDLSHVFSPAFIYNQANNGRDGGCYIADALNILSETGAAPWAEMPYRDNDFKSRPPQKAIEAARRYRADFWRRVNTVDPREVKAQLNAGYPVVIGAKVDDRFLNLKRGEVWTSSGPSKGGHAMLVVGYDDFKNAFKVINSWGSDWADDGYGWIAYQLFRTAVNEGYVVKDAFNGQQPTPAPQPNPTPRPQPTPTPTPRPDPWTPPNPASGLAFRIDRVQHNVPTAQGYYMTIEGSVTIPGGRGRWSQSVVYFYFDAGNGAKGQRVPATVAQHSDPYGYSATGTPGFWIPQNGINTKWTAYIPYTALNTGLGWVRQFNGQWTYNRGSTRIVAEGILFIDNFGVMNGGTFAFPLKY